MMFRDISHSTDSPSDLPEPPRRWVGLGIAAVCFAGMGASDEVSAIFRTTMLLTAAPDEMRGRLQGVFFAVVAGGPRLGDLYTGIMAATVALWAPPLIGGLVIVVLLATILRVRTSFRTYDKRSPALGGLACVTLGLLLGAGVLRRPGPPRVALP